MKKLYFLMLLVASGTSFAQTYNFTVYNTSNSGITSNNINDIKVDGNGLLWLGTTNGVVSFDGGGFTNYNTSNSPLPNNGIAKIQIDGNNKKWIFTYSGLISLSGSTWTTYTTANSGIPSNSVNDIAVDGSNNLWVATPLGLSKFNGTSWTTYNTSNSNIGSNTIGSIAIGSANAVWLVDYNGLLKKFNGSVFTSVGDQASTIYKTINNDVYVRSMSGYTKYTNDAYVATYQYGSSCINDCSLIALDVDASNQVWTGFYSECSTGGLQNFTACTNYLPTNSAIPVDDISSIKVVSANTKWVGTNGGGLVKMVLNAAGPCNAPTNFSVTNVTSTTVTLNWSPATPAPTGYTFYYNNSPVFGGLSGTTASTSAGLTGLLPNSDYYWWVASNCGTGTSDYVLGGFFATAQAPVTPCFQKISAGNGFDAAIKGDGTLWTWGSNINGTLGDGTAVSSSIPKQISNATDWKSISSTAYTTMALKTNGSLWAWGQNTGNIDASMANALVPVQIGTDINWKTVAAGALHTAALKTNGTLWIWGQNNYGQLGLNTSTNYFTPTQVGTDTWNSIAAGDYYTVGIKSNGTLWAWGQNADGQLGDGTTIGRIAPKQIGTSGEWQKVAIGHNHTIAIMTDGSLWTWGNNQNGQLGDGTSEDKTTPTHIGTATDWQSIAGGLDHTVAIKTNGTLWAWGDNTFGELGTGNNVSQYVPVQVGTSTDWQNISCNVSSDIALKNDGSVWTWGRNSSGMLGNGTTVNRNTPGDIGCPTTVLAIEDFGTTDEVKAYPNPVKDRLNITFTTEITKVSIFNLLGQEVTMKMLHAKEGMIDVSNLTAGTYFVKVYADHSVKTLKVIKQ